MEKYDLIPPTRFGTYPEDDDVITWAAYGLMRPMEVALLREAVELTGRLPRNEKQQFMGLYQRGDVGDGEDMELLIDWENKEPGLFEASEISIEWTPDNRFKLNCDLASPLAREDAIRIENLIRNDIAHRLLHVEGSIELDVGRPCMLDDKVLEVMHDISYGILDSKAHLLLPPGGVAFFSSSDERSIGAYEVEARAIAESKAAGEDAYALAELFGSIMDIFLIWKRFDDRSINEIANSGYKRFIEEAGVEGFARSYLEEGVPLEDVLA